MQKIIKAKKLPNIEFTCDECGTSYSSNEYKIGTQPTTIGRIVKTVKTYVDKCPQCRAKNVIREI